MRVKVYTTIYGVANPAQEVIRSHGIDLDKIAQAIATGETEYDPHGERFTYWLGWREPDGAIVLKVVVDENNLVIVAVKVNYD